MEPRTGTQKNESHAQKYANPSRFNNQMNGGTTIQLLIEHENVHVHNEYDIHTSSQNQEVNGYGHDLDLPMISHQVLLCPKSY